MVVPVFRAASAFDNDAGSDLVMLGLCQQFHFRHRCDRGKRLTSETECADTGKVSQTSDLLRRMSLKAKDRVVAGHALAVITYRDKPTAAEFDIDLNASCSGVDRIFDQFFDDGCRTLNDLARGDLICQIVGKNFDLIHSRDIGRDDLYR